MTRKMLICLSAIAGLATLSWAAGKILHPEMTVENGSYDKPMATIGEKPGQPWSTTTTAAGVDSKPQPGKPVSVVGEIVDFSCYLQVGKHGEKHRACGQKCVQNGNAAGLLTKEGALYMLMAEEHDPRRDGQTSGFRKAATDHLGHIMEVTGTQSNVRGYRAIYVEGYVNK